MNYTERFLDHITNNPGTTSAETAAALDYAENKISALASSFTKKGVLRREEFRTATKRKSYRYFLAKPYTPKPSGRPAPEAAPAPQEPAPSTQSLDTLVDDLAGALAHHIVGLVRERLAVELALLIPTTPPIPHRPVIDVEALRARVIAGAPKPDAPRLRSVLIVGLLPQQAGIITQEFGDCLDLRFWKEEGQSKLKSMARGAEHIVTFSGHLGHYVEETIESTGKPYKRIMGGMSQLKEHLVELYAEAP